MRVHGIEGIITAIVHSVVILQRKDDLNNVRRLFSGIGKLQ